jgi:hypothetical protein
MRKLAVVAASAVLEQLMLPAAALAGSATCGGDGTRTVDVSRSSSMKAQAC